MSRRSTSRRRIGIIGAGAIVENAHLPVLLAMNDVDIAWIADAQPVRASLLGRMYRVPTLALEDLESGVRGLDATLLAVPAGARDRYLELCAVAHVAVLCEKPFARDLAEYRARACMFPEMRIGVCMQRRYLLATDVMRRVVHDGRFGRLRSITVSMGGPDLRSGGPDRYLTTAHLAGGGVVIEYGIHGLDQVVSLLDAHTTELVWCRSVAVHGMDYDVSFESIVHGKHESVTVRAEMSRLRPLQQGFWLSFEAARLFVGVSADGPVSAFTLEGEPLVVDVGDARGALTSRQAFHALWRSFLGGLDGGASPACTANSCAATAGWVQQVYDAIRDATPVPGQSERVDANRDYRS